MDRLPIEIVRYICELSCWRDLHTGYQLCLSSRLLKEITTPLLFRHVYLKGSEQIANFNETVTRSPRLGHHISSITVSDRRRQVEEKAYDTTIDEWITLIKIMASLTKQHKLKTIAFSDHACQRLYHYEVKEFKEFTEMWITCDMSVDHLIAINIELQDFIHRFKPKKLTSVNILDWMNGALDFWLFTMISQNKQLVELTLMCLDNSDLLLSPIMGAYDKSSSDSVFRDDLRNLIGVHPNLKTLNFCLENTIDPVKLKELKDICPRGTVSIWSAVEVDSTARWNTYKVLNLDDWSEKELKSIEDVKPKCIEIDSEGKEVDIWCNLILDEDEQKKFTKKQLQRCVG